MEASLGKWDTPTETVKVDPPSTPTAPAEPPPAPKKLAAVFEGAEGAEITVNGSRVGLTPDARMANLDAGKTYQFTAKLAGYKPYAGKFIAKGDGDELTVPFQLVKEEAPRPPKPPVVVADPPPTPKPPTPRPPPPSKATGSLACSTKPAGAEIFVDGKKTGRQTPVTLGSPLVLPVGKRKITFKLNGKTSKPFVVSIAEGKMEKLVNVAIE